MEPSVQTLQQLTDRLETLERRNRRLWQALIGFVAVAAVVTLAAAQKDRPAAVETDKLVLRDANGKPRAQMEVGKEGTVLRFLDERGVNVATLGASQQGLILRFLPVGGRLRSGMALQRDGVALVYYDRDGKAQTGRNALLLGSGVFPPD